MAVFLRAFFQVAQGSYLLGQPPISWDNKGKDQQSLGCAHFWGSSGFYQCCSGLNRTKCLIGKVCWGERAVLGGCIPACVPAGWQNQRSYITLQKSLMKLRCLTVMLVIPGDGDMLECLTSSLPCWVLLSGRHSRDYVGILKLDLRSHHLKDLKGPLYSSCSLQFATVTWFFRSALIRS